MKNLVYDDLGLQFDDSELRDSVLCISNDKIYRTKINGRLTSIEPFKIGSPK